MTDVESKTCYASGNLMIAGEYFVLKGATALAVPLKYGQQMDVTAGEGDQDFIHWKAYETGKLWFEARFRQDMLHIIETSDPEIAGRLQRILHAIQLLKNELLPVPCLITCHIRFPVSWGWGSSSSLIANLARWAEVDPFELHDMVSEGSGYDVAASLSPGPLLFRKTESRMETMPVNFRPPFRDSIHFVYLGNKLSSSESIRQHRALMEKGTAAIPEIDRLTHVIAAEQEIDRFTTALKRHETLLSEALHLEPVGKRFVDFDGAVKSLGAWGGDFAMAVSSRSKEYVAEYFRGKGLRILFQFNDIILEP